MILVYFRWDNWKWIASYWHWGPNLLREYIKSKVYWSILKRSNVWFFLKGWEQKSLRRRVVHENSTVSCHHVTCFFFMEKDIKMSWKLDWIRHKHLRVLWQQCRRLGMSSRCHCHEFLIIWWLMLVFDLINNTTTASCNQTSVYFN